MVLRLYSTQCNLCCFLDFISHGIFLLWNMFFTYNIPHPHIKYVNSILVPNAAHVLYYFEYANICAFAIISKKNIFHNRKIKIAK